MNSIQIETKTSVLSELAVNTNDKVANDLSFVQLVGDKCEYREAKYFFNRWIIHYHKGITSHCASSRNYENV